MNNRKYRPEGGLYGTKANGYYISSLAGLTKAMEDGAIIEAQAIRCDGSMSLLVDLGGCDGIIPKDEVQRPFNGEEVRDIAVITRVGKTVAFKVVGIDKSYVRPKILLSRKAAQCECYDRFISKLKPGDITEAKVTHLETFGAFLDIGCGITSMLPIDNISVSRISHPSDRFFVGQLIPVIISGICDSESDTPGRILVTHKELLGTWQENADLFAAGQTVAGIVRSVEDYGIFIELAPNLAGLAEYRSGIETGQSAAVYIKSIIPDKMKIKLVIVDTARRELPLPQITYFRSEGHISNWLYSPSVCPKRIEKVFE